MAGARTHTKGLALLWRKRLRPFQSQQRNIGPSRPPVVFVPLEIRRPRNIVGYRRTRARMFSPPVAAPDAGLTFIDFGHRHARPLLARSRVRATFIPVASSSATEIPRPAVRRSRAAFVRRGHGATPPWTAPAAPITPSVAAFQIIRHARLWLGARRRSWSWSLFIGAITPPIIGPYFPPPIGSPSGEVSGAASFMAMGSPMGESPGGAAYAPIGSPSGEVGGAASPTPIGSPVGETGGGSASAPIGSPGGESDGGTSPSPIGTPTN